MIAEGSILLWKTKGFIGWCIRRVTGMPWGHAASYVDGMTFESTVWWVGYWWKSGIKQTHGLLIADKYLRLKEPMTLEQVDREVDYWLGKLNWRRPYNVPKLVIKAFVYPLRRWFNKIGWVPFDQPVFGDDCSTSVDEAKKAARIDLLPGELEGYTAPGDFLKSGKLEEYDPAA